MLTVRRTPRNTRAICPQTEFQLSPRCIGLLETVGRQAPARMAISVSGHLQRACVRVRACEPTVAAPMSIASIGAIASSSASSLESYFKNTRTINVDFPSALWAQRAFRSSKPRLIVTRRWRSRERLPINDQADVYPRSIVSFSFAQIGSSRNRSN